MSVHHLLSLFPRNTVFKLYCASPIILLLSHNCHILKGKLYLSQQSNRWLNLTRDPVQIFILLSVFVVIYHDCMSMTSGDFFLWVLSSLDHLIVDEQSLDDVTKIAILQITVPAQLHHCQGLIIHSH